MNAPVKTESETFATAFVKLQAAILPAIKDATNPAFRSKYADLAAVWDAIKKPLELAGFSVIQSPDFDEKDMWLTTTILHVSGEKITGRYPIRPMKQDPQGYGSALTYARRYSISSMLGVIADDDDDGNAASAKPPPRTAAAPVTHPEDTDVIEGVKNWVAKHRVVISSAKQMPQLYDWLDVQGQTEFFDKPKSGSNLDRLKRKSPEAFEEIKCAYMEHLAEIAAAER